jgi:membrane protein DedA with SNARE-associated domain
VTEFIAQYGYIAVALGTFMEGEITILLGILAAQSGLLSLPGVVLAAMAGTIAADQFFFHLGRRRGYRFLARHRHMRRAAAHVRIISRRYQTGLILGFRFLYGLRTVTPLVLGMSRIPPFRFAVLNVIGTALWAGTVTLLGLAFGRLAQRYISAFQEYQLVFIGAVVIIAVLGAISVRLYRRAGQ